jgi:sulfate permease, SulP family
VLAQEARAFTLARLRSFRAFSGDISGGFSSALVAIPHAMSLGLLAFAALGPEYASAGVIAGLVASVIGSLVAAAVPSARSEIVGARASTTVVFASLIAMLVAHPLLQTPQGPNVPEVLTLAFIVLFLSGVLQIVFGLTGLGRAIKYVPYPVISGFMNGIALTILVSQVGPALGMDAGRPMLEALRNVAAIKPASFLVTAAVVAVILVALRFKSRFPPLLCGLAAGIVLHYLVAAVFPDAVGSVVGPLPGFALEPEQMWRMFAFVGANEMEIWVGVLLPHALMLAAVASLDGLLAAVMGDALTHSRHHSRRVLTGQGAANALGAAFGALPTLGTAHTRIANYLAGGRGPVSTLAHAIFMLSAMLALGPLVAYVPVAALAGLMVYISYTLVDRWTRELAQRLREDHWHGEVLVNLGIVAAVALTFLLYNVIAAFAIGVAAAVILLLVKLSGSPVRRELDGSVRSSLKVRSPQVRDALRPLSKHIRILELQGELFFGTADALQREVENLPADTRYVILDFRRVHQVDATGARVLALIGQLATRRRMEVLLTEVREDEPRGRYFTSIGIAAAIPPEQWFPDLDRALEWAEDRLLERARFEDGPELALREMPLFSNLTPEELKTLSGSLERHELGHGDVVFNEGDPGDRMFVIARGAVSIKVRLEDESRARRLATFTPGVFFGEMSLLEGHPRTADAFAKGERVILYSLRGDAFTALVRYHPQLGLKIYESLTRELAGRLRVTTGALRALE